VRGVESVTRYGIRFFVLRLSRCTVYHKADTTLQLIVTNLVFLSECLSMFPPHCIPLPQKSERARARKRRGLRQTLTTPL
jgi:hypothetical protein